MITISSFVVAWYLYWIISIATKALLGVHDPEVYLGMSNKRWFHIRIRKLSLWVGPLLPIPGRLQYRKVSKGQITEEPTSLPFQLTQFARSRRLLATYSAPLGGFLLATLLSVLVLTIQSHRDISRATMDEHGIVPTVDGLFMGLWQGDRVVAGNGQPFDRWSHFLDWQAAAQPGDVLTIERNGERRELEVLQSMEETAHYSFAYLDVPLVTAFLYQFLFSEIPAGAQIIRWDTTEVQNMVVWQQLCEAPPPGEVQFMFQESQEGAPQEYMLDSDYSAGLYVRYDLKPQMYRNSLSEALGEGIKVPFRMLVGSLKSLQFLFSGGPTPSESIPGNKLLNLGPQRQTPWGMMVVNWLVIFCLLSILPLYSSATLGLIPLLRERLTGKVMTRQQFYRLNRVFLFITVGLVLSLFISDLSGLF